MSSRPLDRLSWSRIAVGSRRRRFGGLGVCCWDGDRKERNMKAFGTFALASALTLASISGLAAQGMQGMNSSRMNMQNMMGVHDMAATVSAVDSDTGLVDVDAAGMKLRVHFPPAALSNVKPGDKITLHLGF